jgi:hypothetical protein
LLQVVREVDDLRVATLHNNCSIDFTYNFNMSRFSFLDHFIVSENVYASFIDSCSVRHDGDNLSDHDPSTLSLTIDWSVFFLVPRRYASKCKWRKANADDLLSCMRSLKASLDSLSLPVDAISCHSVPRDNRSHLSALNAICYHAEHCGMKSHLLNDYSNALINARLDSVKHTIPHTAQSRGVRHNNVMPGWNDYVAPLRNKSILYGTISGSSVVVHTKGLLLA